MITVTYIKEKGRKRNTKIATESKDKGVVPLKPFDKSILNKNREFYNIERRNNKIREYFKNINLF